MHPTIIIVGQCNDPIVAEFVSILRNKNLDRILIIQNYKDLMEFINNDREGFLIFTLPPETVTDWLNPLHYSLDKWFKIYYYNYFVSTELQVLLNFEFDFILVGEKRKNEFERVLNFLNKHYTKKIPISIFPRRRGVLSSLMRKVLRIIELHDPKNIDLENVAHLVKTPPQVVRKEIKSNLNLNFYEFRKIIGIYYKTKFI